MKNIKSVKKQYFKLIFLLVFLCFRASAQESGTILFDDDWRFHLGGMQGAESPDFDDSQWRKIDLPHDWSIEDKAGKKSPFSPNAISQVSGGFTSQGSGWYRKTFDIPSNDVDKQIFIQFDGVYMNADVYINGYHMGNHPYGYTGFFYNITNKLNFGKKNTIAVEVKNEGRNSRWYSGSGIYRHVWLKTFNNVHIEQWGVAIRTTEITPNTAKVNIKTELINSNTTDLPVSVVTEFQTAADLVVNKVKSDFVIKAGKHLEIQSNVEIKNPKLWSCESPNLYKAIIKIYRKGKIISENENYFGIRKISFDTNNGFQLNGKAIKLKGGCIHHDNGPLGARAYDRAEIRKVELLKGSGYNAIRCAHNPPSPAFLDACDSLGMLVIDEAFDMWNIGKNPYDYHLYFAENWKSDIKSMILRDRNHPSIIMWSIGNEIPERGETLGVETAQKLSNYIKQIDPDRLITAAVNGLKPDKDPFFSVLDISGYNYAAGGDHLENDIYETDHHRIPDRIMVGTESYPLEAFDSWMEVQDHPYVIGDFVWTAWDYIGEASIGWLGYPQSGDFYPWNLAFCGDIDICGWKRPQSYYRDALWKENQISIFVKSPFPSYKTNPKLESWSKWNWYDVLPDWNWAGYENKLVEVNVYSSCEQVELFLNGKSFGEKETNRSTKFFATWKIPYVAGELKALGFTSGKKANSASLKTANKPVAIKLSADKTLLKSDNQDLSYITVQLVDENGHINPKSDQLINFSIIGDGEIVGVGNANPLSLESYQQTQRRAWKGRCLAIVKSNHNSGKIILKAEGIGLKPAEIELVTRQ